MNKTKQYSGFIAIVGRPNVGKSTLLNQLLGQKISITSHRPQTTRYRIIGIDTDGAHQAIYVDTPGLHIKEKSILNRLMNRVATNAMWGVDLTIFVVESTNWTDDDEWVLNKLRTLKCRVLLAINKIDNLTDKSKLLPHILFLSQQLNFFSVVPISAKKGENIDTIAGIVRQLLPKAAHYFPDGYITDRPQRFMASEIIREKIMRFLGAELPYSVTVKVEQFLLNDSGSYKVYGLILVERECQKKIIIGSHGVKIKNIGVQARHDMEKMFDTKVHLELWVKVKCGWADDELTLCSLGYIEHFN